MPANSLPRRLLKTALTPVVNTRGYHVLRNLAMAWDIRSGAWKEPEIDLIKYVVKPGDTAIDIGANFGIYSYHLAQAVAPTGRVYAFEPIPTTTKGFRLIARLLRFKNVELVEKGCGDRAETINFRVPLQDNGAVIPGVVHAASRNDSRNGREQHARFEKYTELPCEIVRIDDFLPNLERVSFIKCDVEGADFLALRGARKTIERNRPLVVSEINPWFLDGFGIKLEEFVGFFTKMGYGLHRYQDGRLIPTPLEKVVEDNWVFLPEERRGQVASLL
ncbi:MAG TPA: FkbM family methyltransferase [Polyangia bacterium]